MDCSLAGCSVPVVSQLKSTGVGCHFLLQGIFPTQGSNPCLLHWQVNSWPLSYQCVCSVLSDSFATPRTIAHEVPLSMEFSRQEYCSGLPLPSPGDLPHPGIEPGSPVLQADSLPPESPGNLSAVQETAVWSLGWRNPLEKGMATHSSILAWRFHRQRRSLAGCSPWDHKSWTWPSD